MAEARRQRVDDTELNRTVEANREAEKERAARDEAATEPQPPERLGDVLGLSDVTPDVEIPQAARDHGGHPAGTRKDLNE